MMNNFLNDDLIQLISQYSPEVYCLFRLVNKEVKHVVDEILPSGSREQKIRFLQGAHWCGFTLMDQCAFDAWLDALDRVYGNERISGETVEKFCRDYRKKVKNQSGLPRIQQNVLHILCKYNRIEYLNELWKSMQNDESIYCSWMKEVGMLDDLEFIEMVHERFTIHCKDKIKIKNIIRTSIEGAVDCYQWENISYLLGRHPDMKNDQLLNSYSRFVFAKGNEQAFEDDILLQKDRKVVLRAVMQNGSALIYADRSFKKDRQIVLEAVKGCGIALNHANESFRTDKQIILAAVKQDGFALWYADDSLKEDKQIVLAAVKQNGCALQYADYSLTKDKEVVLIAVKQSGRALEYVADSLKKEKEVVFTAVKNYGYALALKYADPFFKKDKDLVLISVKQHGYTLSYADDSLKKDKEVVLIAVKQDGKALQFADDSLKKDKEFAG